MVIRFVLLLNMYFQYNICRTCYSSMGSLKWWLIGLVENSSSEADAAVERRDGGKRVSCRVQCGVASCRGRLSVGILNPRCWSQERGALSGFPLLAQSKLRGITRGGIVEDQSETCQRVLSTISPMARHRRILSPKDQSTTSITQGSRIFPMK